MKNKSVSDSCNELKNETELPADESYYAKDEEGVLYYIIRNLSIIVNENFPEKGKQFSDAISSVIRHAMSNIRNASEY